MVISFNDKPASTSKKVLKKPSTDYQEEVEMQDMSKDTGERKNVVCDKMLSWIIELI